MNTPTYVYHTYYTTSSVTIEKKVAGEFLESF